MDKKESFKLVIKEFHSRELPTVKMREFAVPQINKVISITGSRRSGKTFFFFQKIIELLQTVEKERIVYINFSDDRFYPLKLEELQDLMEAYFELYPDNKGKEIFFFIDEIQEVEKWELFVRRIYDTGKIKIYITGSSSKLLNKEIHTLLRGRTLQYTMFPLSFKEFLWFNDILLEKQFWYTDQRYIIKKTFTEYLNQGGFPEVVLNEQKRELLENYLELIIYKDIIERYKIRNFTVLKMMLKYLLTNISAMFSVNSYFKIINKQVTVKKDTLSEYISYLEDAQVIFMLPFFSYSLKQQQVNPKKAYCIDNGLRNAVSFIFSKDEGRLVENIIFVELMRRKKEVYYWREKGEVDFIIKNRDMSLTAINVEYGESSDKREVKSLYEFKEKFKKTKELFVLTKDTEKKQEGIQFMPVWKWLLIGE